MHATNNDVPPGVRTRVARFAALGAIALAAGAGLAQEPPKDQGFTEKVEVRVRTVLASITDAKGHPLAKPPSPADIQVRENGKTVEVIAVEPVRRAESAGTAAAPGSAAPPQAAPPPVWLPQHLYIETTTMQRRSVNTIALAFRQDLPAILRTGPLEIVLADPTPRVVVSSTTDAAALGAGLDRLLAVQGKESLITIRQDYLQAIQDPEIAPGAARQARPRMPAKASVQQEVQLLQSALGAITRWAGTLPDDRPGIVYLGTDGFDADPTEVYRRTILASKNPSLLQEASQLLTEYEGTVTRLRTQAEQALAARGLRTVVVALGGVRAEFATSAANTHKVSSRSLAEISSGNEVTYFARPTEPLRLIAAATGGEVVSTETKLAEQVGSVGGLYLVTFRTTAPADGTAHELSVASGDPSLKISAPRYLAAATLTSAAAAKTTTALATAHPANAGLEVGVSVEATGRVSKKKMQGELSVSADLAVIAPALEKLGAGRVRVTVAVEIPDSPPFVSHDEVALDHSGEGTMWLYEAKIIWPPEATRVAVTIEELGTGVSGTGVADLPKLP